MNKRLIIKIGVPSAFFLCGLIASLAVLELSLRAVAYVYMHRNAVQNAAAAGDRAGTIVACFGDSFTEGGHSPFNERYPAYLQRMFDAAGGQVRVINYGMCESNSAQVYRRFKKVVEAHRIDYAVVMTGSTNGYNLIGYNDSALMCFLKELRICRLAHVFRIYVRDHALRWRARRAAKQPAFLFETVGTETLPTEEEVRQMALKDPPNGYFIWFRHYLSQGRFADALAVMRAAAAGGKHDRRVERAMAMCYDGMGDYAAAEKMFRASLVTEPEQAYIAFGEYYTRRGDYGMAEKILREAPQHCGREGYCALGLFYRGRGAYAQAEAAFKAGGLQNELINLYAETGRYAEAEALYDDALRFPDTVRADFAILYYVPRGRYADAIRCFLKALDRPAAPTMAPLFLMTRMFRLQSQYSAKDVLAVLDRAVARHPFLANEPTFRAYRECFRDFDNWEKKNRQWLAGDLEKIAALCRKKGITLILLNYPFTFTAANDVMASACRQHRLPLVDVSTQFPVLTARDGKEKYVQKDGHHCTGEGNYVIAENVFKKIQSLRATRKKER